MRWADTAILNNIQGNGEVMEIIDTEGGDLDEIAQRVRERTIQMREMIHQEYRISVTEENGDGLSVLETEVSSTTNQDYFVAQSELMN
jgi:hypothetical protein